MSFFTSIELMPSSIKPLTRNIYRLALASFFIFLLTTMATPLFAATSQIKDISFTKVAGDQVQIRISFDGPAVEPGSFTINQPARIALDFPNTSSRLGWKNKNIGIGFAKSVTAVEAGNRTRVILNLVQLLPFETVVDGRSVVVTLASSRAAAETGPTSRPTTASTVVPGEQSIHSIKNIDFRRGANGEGRIVVTLSDPNTPASTGETGKEIFVDFGNTSLPTELQQRLDVTDFATPVQYIDATSAGNRVRLSIAPSGEYEYLAYQAGTTYTIEVKPVTPEEQEATAEGPEYTGEKLSLNFQDIEVRAVLQLIADFTNLNMVTSDSVKGNLTLRLKNVPWDQALDIVLKTKGLAMRQTGNVILVAPAEEISAREKLELESKKQIEELEPLRSELIQVNYAKADEMAALLESKGTTVMSDRGSVSVDPRTNTIIAVDTADRLGEVRKLINKLDVPVRQVMIDSRIVIANSNFAKDLGAKFGITAKDVGNTSYFTSGSTNATDTMLSGLLDDGIVDLPTGPGGILDRLNSNVPAAPDAGIPGRIAFAILGQDALLDLELSALQIEGKGEIISNPRVVTSDQQEAIIQQGTEIPYQEASSSGATSTSFKEAVLKLQVTPQITPDERIILDLSVNQDDVGSGTFNGVPPINTKAIKTQVLINNGDTVVLGGVYIERNVDSVTRVPFFGDLPFIGALFRSTKQSDSKEELLIFVTPKILKEAVTAATK
ncbi:MAG: type IV pilus secretin PilQ [Gammaproteobacteria bacterium]